VLAHRPKAQVLAGWKPVVDALSRALPDCTFTLEALGYEELEEAIRQDRLDVAITSASHYVQIRERLVAPALLATIVEQGPAGPLPAYGGAIFTRSDRDDVRGLADLARVRVAAVARDSLGGYQAQAYELVRAGIPLPAGDRLRFTGMPHDRVVEEVLAGRADAGFVRTGTLESMARDGRLALQRVRIVNPQDLPDYPYAVSTRLYPEWAVFALPHLDEDHARRIAAALLGLDGPPGPPGESIIHGFTVAADYARVDALLRELRLPPFEGAPSFDAGDVLRRYLVPIVVLGFLLAAVAAATVWAGAVNRRLERARAEAQEALASRDRALAELRDALARLREATAEAEAAGGATPRPPRPGTPR
jgi:ABC-type phosphate/phosphonate transport system substrate-binding protein